MMRGVLLAVAALFIASAAHGSEKPRQYLHCEGVMGDIAVTHDLVIYAHTARFDGVNYALETADDSYVLNGPQVTVADMLKPKSQIVINRITGEYDVVIFDKGMVDYSRPTDKGCVAVRRRL